MDIECKLKRVGGTEVDMITKVYHFAPREDGAHVADVEDPAHQDRFLGIPEAYCLYRGSAPAVAPVEQIPAITDEAEAAKNTGGTPGAAEGRDAALLGSSVHPDTFEIRGATYTLGDVVALAHANSGLDVKEWNELDDASRADLIDEQLDNLNAAPDADEAREAASAQYQEKFGKKPHFRWNAEKILAEIAAG